MPGPTALLAPQWVPWDQRIKPGDLGPGDLLAPPADDPRLVPGYLLSGDPAVDAVAAEIGMGRRKVLSAFGRTDAAQRWHDGEHGPNSAMARSTRRTCRDCGFLLPLAGELGVMFGVCGNELAADGHVVDYGYGCGAHSDTPAPAGTGSPLYDPYDDGVLEVSENAPALELPAEPAPEAPAESATPEAIGAEELVEEAAPGAAEAEAPAAETAVDEEPIPSADA